MKRNTVFYTSVGLFQCLALVATQLSGQEEPTSPPDPFSMIQDAEIRSALARLENLHHPDESQFSDVAVIHGYAEQFRNKEILGACVLLLQKVAAKSLDPNSSVALHVTIADAISGMVAVGTPESLAPLMQLAQSDERWIRNAISSAQTRAETHSYDLMLALAKEAESRLPNSLSKPRDADDAFRELEDRLRLFCSYTQPSERGAAQEIVNRFLSRYSDRSIREFYENRLNEFLSPNFPLTAHAANATNQATVIRSSPTETEKTSAIPKLHSNRTLEKPSASETESKSWLMWLLIVIAAAIGAAWLLLRKSKP